MMVTNFDTVPVTVGNLCFKMWLNEATLANIDTWIGTGQVCNNGGGGCVNVTNTGFSATMSFLSSPCTVDSTHIANQVIIFCANGSTQTIPANGGVWNNGFDLSMGMTPNMDDVFVDDYSKTAVVSSTFVDDSHFGLYFNGSLVNEWVNATTPDSNTGASPCCGAGGPAAPAPGGGVGAAVVNASEKSSLPLVTAEPNVSRNGAPIQFLVNLAQSAKLNLSLYSVAGERVYQTTLQGAAGVNTIPWSLQNQANSLVAAGLYIYVLQVDDPSGITTRLGKLAVLH